MSINIILALQQKHKGKSRHSIFANNNGTPLQWKMPLRLYHKESTALVHHWKPAISFREQWNVQTIIQYMPKKYVEVFSSKECWLTSEGFPKENPCRNRLIEKDAPRSALKQRPCLTKTFMQLCSWHGTLKDGPYYLPTLGAVQVQPIYLND